MFGLREFTSAEDYSDREGVHRCNYCRNSYVRIRVSIIRQVTDINTTKFL